jgi:geranylgeranyl diphosphate synthase type II
LDIRAYLREEKEAVDRHLAGIIAGWPAAGSAGYDLARAMAYSLNAGGKRLRPILTITAFRVCEGESEQVYPAACALEMIHTYTLIHDDLPAMDNDDFRRGLPTCHRKFGVNRAINAGVGLLLAAFEELSRSASSLGLTTREKEDVVLSVAEAVGGGGVAGGQVVDLESEHKKVDRQTLHYIHTHKTGALIRVSCTLGGRLARAHGTKLEALARYGEKIGLAFQIVDDLLDIEGDAEKLGKQVGADQARGKATFPSVFGLEESRRLAARAVEQAKLELGRAKFNQDSPLGPIADLILSRKS